MVDLSLRFFWIREEGKIQFAFCGLFKARVGVFVLSCQGVTLMIITTLLNCYTENGERLPVQAVQYCLLGFYLFIMYTGFTIAFIAAFWEYSKYIKVGAYLICAGMMVYIVLTILSFIPNYHIMKNVCPGLRCPDHHWLHQDRWRSVIIELEYSEDSHSEERGVGTTGQPINPAPPGYPGIPGFPGPYQPSLHQTDVYNFINLLLKNDSSSGIILDKHNSDMNLDKLNFSMIPHSLISYAHTMISEFRKKDIGNIQMKGSNNGSSVNRRLIWERKLINFLKQQKGPDYKEQRGSSGNMLFIIVSVLYVIIYLGYLLYTILTFLAFARQLDS